MNQVVLDSPTFFTTASLAKKLQLSERYIKDLVGSGELASYKIGRARRIDPQDVALWLQSQREAA